MGVKSIKVQILFCSGSNLLRETKGVVALSDFYQKHTVHPSPLFCSQTNLVGEFYEKLIFLLYWHRWRRRRMNRHTTILGDPQRRGRRGRVAYMVLKASDHHGF
jgi:hypothetical protein